MQLKERTTYGKRFGGYILVTREDLAHDYHHTETIEHVYDNPVEVTEWVHCLTCKVDYMSTSSTLEEDAG